MKEKAEGKLSELRKAHDKKDMAKEEVAKAEAGKNQGRSPGRPG